MDHLDYDQLLKEATVHFSRSSGKGGQNVNKVETRVELIFNIAASHVLDEPTKTLLLSALKNKIDHEGNLRIVSSSERLQHSNRKKAEEKFVKLISTALKPKKKRVKTEPSLAAKRVRRDEKRRASIKKHERKKFSFE